MTEWREALPCRRRLCSLTRKSIITQPHVLEGTPEQIVKHFETLPQHERYRVTIVPEGTRLKEPAAEDIAQANLRLSRHIVHGRGAGGLDNEQIDADLAQEYANILKEAE